MPRKSVISQMPDEIQQAVAEAIREDRATIDEITQMIRQMGGEVSRSAVGSYVKKANEAMERYRKTQSVAKTFAENMQASGDAAQVARQVIAASVFDIVNGINGGADSADEVDIKSLSAAARTLRDVAASAKIDAEARMKIREELKEEMAQEMAELAGKAESRDGKIDADKLRQMIRESYGV